MSFSKRFCAKSPFKKNGNNNHKDKKSNKEKPHDWGPTIKRLSKERVKGGIYIT